MSKLSPKIDLTQPECLMKNNAYLMDSLTFVQVTAKINRLIRNYKKYLAASVV